MKNHVRKGEKQMFCVNKRVVVYALGGMCCVCIFFCVRNVKVFNFLIELTESLNCDGGNHACFDLV